MNTRLPTFANGTPDQERRSFNLHDPLPEEDLGPETYVRPRGFIEQRSEPRRTLEGRSLIGAPVVPGGPAPSLGMEYQQAVPQ